MGLVHLHKGPGTRGWGTPPWIGPMTSEWDPPTTVDRHTPVEINLVPSCMYTGRDDQFGKVI